MDKRLIYLRTLNRPVMQDGLKKKKYEYNACFLQFFLLGLFYGSDYTKIKDTFSKVTFTKQH